MTGIEKRNYFFLFFLTLVSLLPYFFLSLYAHPAGDDFVYAYNGKHFGLIENASRDYFHWGGRYVSNFLFVLNPMAFDSLKGYRLIAVILVLLTFISFYFLIRSIAPVAVPGTYLILSGGILSCLFLHQMPSLAQGIYWYTGAVIYQGANVLTPLYLACLTFLLNKKYLISKFIHLRICLALIFIITGCNETIMIFLLFFHAFLSAKKRDRLSFLLFTFSILCSLLVFFSPGNAVREAVFPDRHHFFHSLLFSMAQSCRFFKEWIINIPLLIASILYIPVSIRFSKTSGLFKNNFYISPFLSTCFLFFVIFLSAFPAYWSTGILGQHRTVNSAYFFFLILWFMNLTVWVNFLANKKITAIVSNLAEKYFVSLFILMMLFSLITGNG